MLNRKRQLLCTFSNSRDYLSLVPKITKLYDIVENKIFVFVNEKITTEYYMTYNVDTTNSGVGKFPNTISIHRKKMYNTLYTLNGMNTLITEENNGVFDKTFQLSWELYKNSLILTTDVGIKVVSLKIVDIIEV